MALRPGEAPETVHGRDERVQVDPTTSPPYNWICLLWINRANGQSGYYVGSGFKIHLPDINRTAIVTSGHCTYDRGAQAYFPSITVWFPGQKKVEVVSNDLYAAPEYIKDGIPNHDYGLILLPYGSDNEGFGWSAIIPDDELKNRLVTNCGYPSDKRPNGSMWITGRKIEKVENHRLFYMNDTYGGQSGSPVYTWYDGYWTVIAVHSYGGFPNSAPRITHQMISRFLDRMGGLKAISLRSVKFPDVYLGCDNKRVLCQNKPPTSSTKFYIYPIEMPPSLALETDIRKVVIESVKWRNTFIRMDARDMTKFESSGGGEVKCHFIATSSWESYYVKEEEKTEKGKFSFRNVMFPKCYIRLDGPSGTINCQYYEYKRAWKPRPKPTAYPWEWFYIEEHQ